jgi:hypothetical protein
MKKNIKLKEYYNSIETMLQDNDEMKQLVDERKRFWEEKRDKLAAETFKHGFATRMKADG